MAGKKQKISAKQAEERRQAALERQRKQAEKQKRAEFIKRIGVIVVCVILALALSIPTVGLMFIGGAS
ncbi:CASC3 protein CASC3 [Anaerotardibacter muris]|uniref:CASC3 protein CASC3 n=1 Tax=Anaerotardibacter muris TaxID=2941505 RepID=UPI00203C32DB|nr:CASC3 protein CASC3 [Anaerotardibacter muris]